MRLALGFAALCFAISIEFAHAIVIHDGDFSAWNFDATGTATVLLEPSNGNPGARLNISTVSGPTVYGTAIKPDFSTQDLLEGATFTLSLDVLSGPGGFGEGQGISLLVMQGATVYESYLGITGFPHNWDTLSFTGSFISSSFTRLIGADPINPDFTGGVETFFGFADSNTISGTLTQYYDNFHLESTVLVPEPTTLPLLMWGWCV